MGYEEYMGQKSVPSCLYEIHQGNRYCVQDYLTTTTATISSWLFRTPATGAAHFIFNIRSSLNGIVEFFEGASISALGTTLTIYNNNRNSSNVSGCGFYRAPTVETTGGNRISVNSMGTDGATPLGDSGGISERGNEIVLKASTDYLIRYTTLTDNNRVSVCLDFGMEGAK